MTEDIAHQDIKRGFLWLGGASVVARVIDATSVLVVMWFTSRQELGLATLAWSIAVFLEAANGLGVGTAILQARDLTERRTASAFWYALTFATVAVVLVSAASPWLASWFDAPSLAPLIAVSSLKLWFVSLALVPLTLLNRATAFPKIAAVQTGATLGSAFLTILLVMLGYGAWGIVLGHTAHGLVTALLAHLMHPYRPHGGFSRLESRDDIRFGLSVTSSSLLYHFYRNADYYLIGRFLGVGAVGVYRVAYDLAMTPTTAALGVVNRSALPVYARLSQRADALREALLWTLSSLGLMLAPLTVLTAFLADDILRWVDQGRWLDAAPMVRWLAVAALLRCVAQTFPQVFHAMRRGRLAVVDSLFSALCVVSLISLALWQWGASQGPLVAAQAWVLVYALTIAVLLRLLRTVLVVPFTSLMYAMRHTWGSLSLATLAAVLAVRVALDWPPTLRVALIVGAVVAVELLYLQRVAHIRWRDLFSTRSAEASGTSA